MVLGAWLFKAHCAPWWSTQKVSSSLAGAGSSAKLERAAGSGAACAPSRRRLGRVWTPCSCWRWAGSAPAAAAAAAAALSVRSALALAGVPAGAAHRRPGFHLASSRAGVVGACVRPDQASSVRTEALFKRVLELTVSDRVGRGASRNAARRSTSVTGARRQRDSVRQSHLHPASTRV